MSETESVSERELAEQLQEELFSGKPRSVGEALAAADAETEPAPELEEPAEPAPIVVTDEPDQQGLPVEAPEIPPSDEPGRDDEKEPEALAEEEEEEEGDDPNVVWAKKKYGEEVPPKAARALFEQERMISRQAGQIKESEELASQWYEYAQSVEANAQSQARMGMPLSSQEEQWIENSVTNPLEFARQAAFQGNVPLYNGIIARVAEENPMLAGQIGAQVQMEMQAIAASESNGTQEPSLQDSLGQSISRLGIDLGTYGEAMAEKVAELGEFHPYVQTIMGGDQNGRDIALMAVYDLVRASSVTRRRVRTEEHDERIRQEADMRRQAAGVVTGGPTQPPPKTDPFLAAMEDEWRQRGQWSEE